MYIENCNDNNSKTVHREQEGKVAKLHSLEHEEGTVSINIEYKFPKLFMQYARWNIKKVANYDTRHIRAYGEVQIPPEKKGLYIIYDRNDIVLYVGINEEGETSNLNTRLYDHITKAEFKDHIYLVETYIIEDNEAREIYEQLLINTLFPIFNISKTLYPSQKETYLSSKPYVYNEFDLTDFENVAKNDNVAPVYLLLFHYWSQEQEDDSNEAIYSWIKNGSEGWIETIAERNCISKKAVLRDAKKYIRIVNDVGDEQDLKTFEQEELDSNIFASYNVFKWSKFC